MRRLSSSSHTPPAAKEKQRRDQMKDLYSTLATLLHIQPYIFATRSALLFMESKSLPDFVHRATTSLKHLKERVERLTIRKVELEKEVNHNGESKHISERMLKVVQVTESVDLKLEVNMMLMMNNKRVGVPIEVLRVIEQGGGEIKSYNFCTIGHQTYCTIHAQAIQARLGVDAKSIESQLMELVC